MIHFEAPGCRAACRAGDMPVPAWARTMTPADVTCGHCRKIIAVVHYAPDGAAACRPGDRVLTGLATPATEDVTCDRCRKTPAGLTPEEEELPNWVPVFFNVNEEGEVYDEPHAALDPALGVLREFPNDTIAVRLVSPAHLQRMTDEDYDLDAVLRDGMTVDEYIRATRPRAGEEQE